MNHVCMEITWFGYRRNRTEVVEQQVCLVLKVTLHNLGKVYHDIKDCSSSPWKSSQTNQGLTKAPHPHNTDLMTQGLLDPVATLSWRIYEINWHLLFASFIKKIYFLKKNRIKNYNLKWMRAHKVENTEMMLIQIIVPFLLFENCIFWLSHTKNFSFLIEEETIKHSRFSFTFWNTKY